jgi:hypothetical protein
MAEHVIGFLEAVEIEAEEREASVVFPRLTDLCIETLKE